MTTPRNKQREVNQLCLLTKTLKKFISLNSKSPQCYVLPFFSNFCFSFFILSLSSLCLSPNIFSRSDISNPLTIMVWRFSHAYWVLALISWLFFFGLVVIFSSLLPAHATILNILCLPGPLLIYLLHVPDHVHCSVQVLPLKPYQQGRTDTHSHLVC